MPSEFQSNEPSPCPWNSSRRNPPCPRNSSRRNPPSPSEFRDAARGMGMDIFWNHPLREIQFKFPTLPMQRSNPPLPGHDAQSNAGGGEC